MAKHIATRGVFAQQFPTVIAMLAQATAWDRSLFLLRAFLWLLAGAAALSLLYLIAYVLLHPVLQLAETPRLQRTRRIMTGYAIVVPLVLFNLVIVFGLFCLQFAAVHGLYGDVAGPQRVFERAFASAGGTVGQNPLAQALDRMKESAFGQSAYYGPTAGFTKFVWFFSGALNWLILLSLLVALLRDLGITSWSFVAAPFQREVQGRPWDALWRPAAARFLHLILYTLAAGLFFVVASAGVLALGWLTLRMIAGLLLTYLVVVKEAWSGLLAFLLLGSFYVLMLEVLGLFFFVTSLLAFIASRSISLRIEDGLASMLRLPRTELPPPKILPPLRASALLLLKVLAATVPLWAVMMVVGRWFPLVLSSPMAVALHIGGFNLVLILLKAYRDFKPLAIEAWAGRPWLALEQRPAPADVRG